MATSSSRETQAGTSSSASRRRDLRTTFGGPESVLTLTLRAVGEETELELDHTVPIAMAQSVAGALFVGPGWDGAFIGLGLYVDGEPIGDPQEMANDPILFPVMRRSIELWTEVVSASGATPEETGGRPADVDRPVRPSGPGDHLTGRPRLSPGTCLRHSRWRHGSARTATVVR